MTTDFAARILRRAGPGIASGAAAASAYVHWLASARDARDRRTVTASGEPISAAQPATPARAVITPRYRVGSAVWVRADDGCAWWRGQVLGHDPISGRALIADVDRRHVQRYCATDQLAVRFAGDRGPTEPIAERSGDVGHGGTP